MKESTSEGFRGADLSGLSRELGGILTRIFRGERLFPEAATAAPPPIPEKGVGSDGVPRLWSLIEQQSTFLTSPCMLAHMDVAPHPVAALTQALTSALSNNLLFRELSPFASNAEEQLLELFVSRLGLGASAGGTFVSGGSLANLSCLFAAMGGFASMPDRGSFHLYCPASVHLSVTKSAAVLGVPAGNVVRIACDDGGRIRIDALREALSGRPARSRAVIVAVAGTTIHGSIDPLADIAALAEEHEAWLHIDAIYGAALAFSSRRQILLSGLDRADSIAIGPQKWMYVPRLSAAILFKDKSAFERRLGTALPYSFTALPHRGQWGLQSSRPADALILWMVLQTIGTDTMREVIDHGIDTTKRFHAMVKATPGLVPTHEPDLNIQAFKLRADDPGGATLTRIHQALTRTNKAWFSLSKWGDDVLLRAVLLAPMLEEEHLEKALAVLRTAMEETGN